MLKVMDKNKSKKITVFYIIFSMVLLIALGVGGAYGIYVSVGMQFMRSTAGNFMPAQNVAGNASMAGAGEMVPRVATGSSFPANNVYYSGQVSFNSSMIGIIILSIALLILSILDIISLIKQIVLFKQFKIVRESNFEKKQEAKVKSKGGVIFFACVVDILSLAAGIIGIVLNLRNFSFGNFWILNLIDGIVSIFALLSFVFLLVKISKLKKQKPENKNNERVLNKQKTENIDGLEYDLIKLQNLKKSKMISVKDYEKLHKQLLESYKSKF